MLCLGLYCEKFFHFSCTAWRCVLVYFYHEIHSSSGFSTKFHRPSVTVSLFRVNAHRVSRKSWTFRLVISSLYKTSIVFGLPLVTSRYAAEELFILFSQLWLSLCTLKTSTPQLNSGNSVDTQLFRQNGSLCDPRLFSQQYPKWQLNGGHFVYTM